MALSTAGSAQADIPNDRSCPNGYLCVWEGDNASGKRGIMQHDNWAWSSSWSITRDDDSWFNNSAYGNWVTVYRRIGWDYPTVCIAPNRGRWSASSWLSNAGSSNYWAYDC